MTRLFSKLLLLSSAFQFKSFSRPLELFAHTDGENNFGNKIPFKLQEQESNLPHFVFFSNNSTEACCIQ